MTLSRFIDSGGIPAEESFYLYNPRVFGGMMDCVRDKAMLNRRLACNWVSRLVRRLYYDHGIGHVPLRRDAFEASLLFWGCHDGDIMLQSVESLFERIERKSRNRHVVVIGATDDCFTEEMASLIPEQVEMVFALNAAVDHPKVTWYPLGRDDAGLEYFDISPKPDKLEKIYCNFSPGTHESRKRIITLLEGEPFVTRVDVCGYGRYNGYPMSNREFLEHLNMHAFCACPRGGGIDTFRLWDSLHLGVVPVVVREPLVHRQLEKLPVLILDSVEDFANLTEVFLKQTYAEMLDTEYDFSILTADYWRDRFTGHIKEEAVR